MWVNSQDKEIVDNTAEEADEEKEDIRETAQGEIASLPEETEQREEMVSEKTKEAVNEHLSECRDIYEKMKSPEPKAEFETEPAESFKKYVKKKKMRFGWKVALITVIVVLSVILLWLVLMGGQ